MRRRHYLVLAGVLLLTVVLLNLPVRPAAQVKAAIGSLFLPLFGLAGSGERLAGRAGDAVVPRRDLLRQLEELKAENARWQVLAHHTAELERENERLRALLGFQKTAPWKIKPARVVARDPANWWRNVRIDLGRRDGLRADLPVMTAEGLVGRVSDVDENFARVVLLGDPNCRVPAVVMDHQMRQPVDNGVIIGGAGILDENMVELAYLSKASPVKPGQPVRTSGFSAIYPKGIMLGEIIDTRPVDFGLTTVARVRLAARLNLLEEVWVVLP